MKPLRDSLPAGIVLDCYVVTKLIASGGYSLIYLAEDEETQHEVIIDFGAVFQLYKEDRRRGQVVTPGFSPVEQYYHNGDVGPWSDVYSIGASMRAVSTVPHHFQLLNDTLMTN